MADQRASNSSKTIPTISNGPSDVPELSRETLHQAEADEHDRSEDMMSRHPQDRAVDEQRIDHQGSVPRALRLGQKDDGPAEADHDGEHPL